jgi:hypothetical protein
LLTKIDREADNFLKMTQELKSKFVKEYPKSAENVKNAGKIEIEKIANFEKLFNDLENVGRSIQQNLQVLLRKSQNFSD